MLSILLVIIYISFISLGLPDALLGSAWPSMYRQLAVPVSSAGIISMIIAGGTIVSSFFSDKLIKKLGTGKVTTISVFMTALALLGFSISPSFLALCLWAIPYGLGAGSVDAALNNFVALHYKARHMSWLHSFWGVGATVGPVIMGFCLTNNLGWNKGYQTVFIIQIILTALLLFSQPLWKKAEAMQSISPEKNPKNRRNLSLKELLNMPGAKPALLAFFCYCGLESTTGLWGSTYMVSNRGISPDVAAKWISFYYSGITVGRFIAGFISMKTSMRSMVRWGQSAILCGILLLILPVGNTAMGAGFVLIGLGCAPIFPSLLHATPDNFGKDVSQSIMGMQMASAYTGTTLVPPLVGLVLQNISPATYPFFLLALIAIMFFMTERLAGVKKGL